MRHNKMYNHGYHIMEGLPIVNSLTVDGALLYIAIYLIFPRVFTAVSFPGLRHPTNQQVAVDNSE